MCQSKKSAPPAKWYSSPNVLLVFVDWYNGIYN
jgi:hypothetical protein